MAAYRRVYDSRHLQADAKNRDQLRNPALAIIEYALLFNYIKQHSENVMVWNYQNADCSLRNKFTVLFIVFVPYFHFPAFSALPDNNLTRSVSEMIKVREIATTEYDS